MNKIILPQELSHSFFFPENEFPWQENATKLFIKNQPFIHEIALYSGKETVAPWHDPERYIPELLEEWQRLHDEIRSLFRVRDKKNTLSPMKQGMGILLECIFWTNGLPVKLHHEIDFSTVRIKPVNITERMNFLMKQPTIYPSLIQLNELMEEQEKQFSKYIAVKNAFKKN